MRKILVKVVNQDLEHLLENIHAETLLVWGDKDLEVPVDETKIFKQKIKNALVRIVWEAKHKPHLEKPQKFIEILQEFLC
jgi:pimeloyl-ACP methyl ester carboxylesterase